jgi:hypothetical protein
VATYFKRYSSFLLLFLFFCDACALFKGKIDHGTFYEECEIFLFHNNETVNFPLQSSTSIVVDPIFAKNIPTYLKKGYTVAFWDDNVDNVNSPAAFFSTCVDMHIAPFSNLSHMLELPWWHLKVPRHSTIYLPRNNVQILRNNLKDHYLLGVTVTRTLIKRPGQKRSEPERLELKNEDVAISVMSGDSILLSTRLDIMRNLFQE